MELYKIQERIRKHLNLMEECTNKETGEVSQLFYDQLDALDIEVMYKIESIGVFMRELKGDIATIRDERHRLEARELSMKKSVDWLTNYVSSTMRALGITKHRSPNGLFTVYMQKNPDKVEVDYPANLPAKYQRVPPVEAMLKDLKIAIGINAVSKSVLEKAGVRTITGEMKVRYR